MDRQTVDFAEQKRRADRNYLPYRILQESWWPQELPTEGELQEGLRNLERYHYEVDYVITHCCASTLQDRINAGTGRSCAPDLLTDYLETLEQKLHYRHWYFGHYHRDCQPDDKHTLVYYAIPAAGAEGKCSCSASAGTDGRSNGSWQGMRMLEFFRIQKNG